MGRGEKNFDSSLLANEKEQESSKMTRPSPKPVTDGNDKRQFTWNEIRSHRSKTERWIVIDKRVYDVTRWTKHPGGQAVLKNYTGQDATEAFRALHPDVAFVQKYLKIFDIGEVIDEEKNIGTDDRALKEDFERLRQKAISKNLFQSRPLFFLLTCLHILAFEFAAYYVLFRFGITWTPYFFSFLFYVIAAAQSGWMQHDFGHLSVFKKASWNHTLHQFSIGLLKGGSADWWNHMHFQHHSKPNVIDKDPDTRIETLFLLGDTIPIRTAQTNAKYGKKMPYNLQHLYFFIVAPLLFPIYFQLMTIRHILTRRKWIDLAWSSLYYVKFFSLLPIQLGLFGAFKLFFLIRIFEGTWFVIVTQSNHVVMDVSHDDSYMAWFRMQLKATCNIAKSPFNDWFTGHLNFQIEHHLFPMMPRHNLYKLQPEVKDLCQKYHIPYIVKPMGRAFLDILTSLEKSGRMWMEAYEELMEPTSTKGD